MRTNDIKNFTEYRDMVAELSDREIVRDNILLRHERNRLRRQLQVAIDHEEELLKELLIGFLRPDTLKQIRSAARSWIVWLDEAIELQEQEA